MNEVIKSVYLYLETRILYRATRERYPQSLDIGQLDTGNLESKLSGKALAEVTHTINT